MTGPVERVPLTDEQPPYEPFDQDRRLLPPPWEPTDPAVIAWQAAHGHDVRLKCYPEFGCLVIEGALERKVERLEAELRASRAREQELRIHAAGLEASLAERVLERDRRQQRIDKALGLVGNLPYSYHVTAIRAALTGTGAVQPQRPERLKCLLCDEPGDYGGFCQQHCRPGLAPEDGEL